jgi:hypothetical protein
VVTGGGQTIPVVLPPEDPEVVPLVAPLAVLVLPALELVAPLVPVAPDEVVAPCPEPLPEVDRPFEPECEEALV